MANLTLKIDDDVLRRARVHALRQGTSVNAVVRAYLEEFAEEDEQTQGFDRFLELAASSTAGSDERGRKWTRDELYDR